MSVQKKGTLKTFTVFLFWINPWFRVNYQIQPWGKRESVGSRRPIITWGRKMIYYNVSWEFMTCSSLHRPFHIYHVWIFKNLNNASYMSEINSLSFKKKWISNKPRSFGLFMRDPWATKMLGKVVHTCTTALFCGKGPEHLPDFQADFWHKEIKNHCHKAFMAV